MVQRFMRSMSIVWVKKGHKYMTVVCDLENATVEPVTEDRRSESLEAFCHSLSPEQLTAISPIAMDMWTPYLQATIKCMPDAGGKIVFDRFHVMNHMVKAVDKVRRQNHRRLSAAGDDTLKGNKFLWLYSEENLPDKQRLILETLKELHLNGGRAWAIKESLRSLWDYSQEVWARRSNGSPGPHTHAWSRFARWPS